jgi:tyrosyl-tRNA synthetase
VDDADVEKCLALLTFLPMDEVRRLGSLPGEKINEAKKILAYEVTKIVHGEKEAEKAKKAAEALFVGGQQDMNNVPTVEIHKDSLGSFIVDLLVDVDILPSKSEVRRLIKQNGLTVNDKKVTDPNYVVTEDDFKDGYMLVRRGKKNYNRIALK